MGCQHMQKYLTKFFPTVNKVVLGKSKGDANTITTLVDKILYKTDQFVPMKVKIVVGQKLFKRKSNEIKASIENSTHIVEDDSIIEEFCGKGYKKSKMDRYDSVFEELEKESEKQERN